MQFTQYTLLAFDEVSTKESQKDDFFGIWTENSALRADFHKSYVMSTTCRLKNQPRNVGISSVLISFIQIRSFFQEPPASLNIWSTAMLNMIGIGFW